jgi:hypothetical protein
VNRYYSLFDKPNDLLITQRFYGDLMNLMLLTFLACGDKEEDTGIIEDAAEDTEDTEDTDDTDDTDDTEEPPVEDLELNGNHVDNWGGQHDISNATWSSSSALFHISQYSNDDDWAVAQNDAGNSWNPDLWSKFDWTESNGSLYYCQSAYDAATEEDAMAATSDAMDLDTGCGGFGWSELRAPLHYAGSYTDNWRDSHSIDAFTWSTGDSSYHITDSTVDYAIAQNDAANSWNPELWSKFEWTETNGALYYCQSAYAAESEADAMMAQADTADLSSGCGGFGWTEIRVEFSYTGFFTDIWGGEHTIDAFSWDSESSSYHVSQYSNVDGWMVAQNDAGNSWNPGLWSRFDILDTTSETDGGLYYCQSAYDAEAEADALAATADATNLTGGCGGFGWTQFITE